MEIHNLLLAFIGLMLVVHNILLYKHTRKKSNRRRVQKKESKKEVPKAEPVKRFRARTYEERPLT